MILQTSSVVSWDSNKQESPADREKVLGILDETARKSSVRCVVYSRLSGYKIINIGESELFYLPDLFSRKILCGILKKEIKNSVDIRAGDIFVRMEIDISLFDESQKISILNCLPRFNPHISECIRSFNFENKLLSEDYWNEGMTNSDELYYTNSVHPLFVDEMRESFFPKGTNICDPACSGGLLIKVIHAKYPFCNFYASDINEGAVTKTRKRLSLHTIFGNKHHIPSENILCSNAKTLDYLSDESVDLFLCSGLFAYQVIGRDDAKIILRNLHKKLKKSGRIFIASKTYPILFRNDFSEAGFSIIKCSKWDGTFFSPFYVLEK